MTSLNKGWNFNKPENSQLAAAAAKVTITIEL
jgi:hypothetical protein